MANMITVLTGPIARNGMTSTYTTLGHSLSKPKLVIQKGKAPSNPDASGESRVSVIHATTNSDGDILAGKIVLESSCRHPVNGQETDLDAAIVIFRDFVASDQFVTAIKAHAPIGG